MKKLSLPTNSWARQASPRVQKVADLILRELAQLIQREMRDPRIGIVTLSWVEVSKDLKHAKVFFSVMDEEGDGEEAAGILNHASAFFRRLLAQQLKLRITPALRFCFDSSIREASRISGLLQKSQ